MPFCYCRPSFTDRLILLIRDAPASYWVNVGHWSNFAKRFMIFNNIVARAYTLEANQHMLRDRRKIILRNA